MQSNTLTIEQPHTNSTVIQRTCPSCGFHNEGTLTLSYAPREWPMKQCIRCNMVYLEKAWSLDVLYEERSWDKVFRVEYRRRNNIEKRTSRVRKYIRRCRNRFLPRTNTSTLIELYTKTGNILDVGSGAGQYLLALPEHYVPYGIEIASQAVNTGRPHIQARGGDLFNKDALAGLHSFEREFFSGIIMRSFLEHDTRPREVLEESYRVLARGGVLVIKVPNYGCLNRRLMGKKWCGFRFPEHVNYFTPKSLTQILVQAGFNIRRFSFIDRLPTSDNMWIIASK